MATRKGPLPRAPACGAMGAWARTQGMKRTPATKNMNIFKELFLPFKIIKEEK
jgi:hypothetical protein